jgi:hypothetical protein
VQLRDGTVAFCKPTAATPPVATPGNPRDTATIGRRAPRIINDPTVGTSDTAETGLRANSLIPKDRTGGKANEC